jgi:hypothetical protein
MAQELTQEESQLYAEVYVPAFIEKCAERGITFPDGETLDEGLETVAHLKAAMLSDQGNQVKRANAAVRQAMGLPSRAAEARVAQTKQASSALSQVPALKAAALAILRKNG